MAAMAHRTAVSLVTMRAARTVHATIRVVTVHQALAIQWEAKIDVALLCPIDTQTNMLPQVCTMIIIIIIEVEKSLTEEALVVVEVVIERRTIVHIVVHHNDGHLAMVTTSNTVN